MTAAPPSASESLRSDSLFRSERRALRPSLSRIRADHATHCRVNS